MGVVTEIIDSFPVDDKVLRLSRNEELLLTKPEPGVMKFWRDYDLLTAYHQPTKYFESKFAPPLGIYESDFVRVEWQKLNQRQPFYHRNADVDEISYHVSGQRWLITEKGTVELQEQEFTRIPVSVAHDNRGIDDVHLIFYIPAPVTECVQAAGVTKYSNPPFPGWEAKNIPEMMTECLGAMGCDVSVSMIDENLLLEAGKTESEPIKVLKGSKTDETEWLYKSKLVWLGTTTLTKTHGDVYTRHRRADEIQCQIKGHRTLVTQRGTIELDPGDFTCIPLGTAFTDIVDGESTHISVLTRWPAPPKREVSKRATETSIQLVEKLRNK